MIAPVITGTFENAYPKSPLCPDILFDVRSPWTNHLHSSIDFGHESLRNQNG